MNQRDFTAIQWGTSALIARRMAADGTLIRKAERSAVLIDTGQEEIISLLKQISAEVGYMDRSEPVWLAGMIGSGMGWREIERVACPANASDICQGVQVDRIGDVPVAFIPGLSCVSRFGDVDVMRGEEISALGVLESYPDQRIILLSAPGMHGKWVELGAGVIHSFHTAMTVELAKIVSEFSVLRTHIGKPPIADEAFHAGVKRGLKGGGLARLIFSVRSSALSGRIEVAQTASHLWGLLIGAELHELRFDCYEQVLVGGEGQITSLYRAALQGLGIHATAIGDHVSSLGFVRIREQSRMPA
jgi:2-dehydro-3-deoxygalactonokinase